VVADVAQGGRSEERVHDRVGQHVGVRVPLEASPVGDFHAADDQLAAGGERVLLARAEQARDVLPAGLSERGYAVDVLAVYRTVTATPDPDVLERVRRGDVDALTFTSSSTVTNFCDAVGTIAGDRHSVISIGPVTSQTARDRGLRSRTRGPE